MSGITGRPSTEDVLVNIEAAERSGTKLLFRNAGVLFFAKNVRHFFNQAYITCLLAKGTDKVHILDRKDFAGGIVADIEDSLRFIERNTRTAYRIEGLRREDVPEYPMKALREAITNAVMHRDWFMEGANVFVEIYTDRIEISSPGGLPKGMKLADLGRKSIRRNALLADLLHRITFIEKAGTGIKRMREEARAQHCPPPTFEENGFFTAIFYPSPEVRTQAGAKEAPSTAQVGTKKGSNQAHDEAHDKAHEVEATPQVPPKHPSSAPQVAGQVGTKLALSRHQVEILRKCIKDSMLVDLMAIAERSDRTKFRHQVLNPLIKAGWIEMTIPEKPRSSKQRYRTTAAGRTVLAHAEKETPS